MDKALQNRLQSIQMGTAQHYKNITILPLIAAQDGSVQYRTLGDALAGSHVAVTETSSAGTVPELFVINRSADPILLLDGEELSGAKQNRVLNTSILLKASSETKIPVSCTEQGRWSYNSKTFQESGNIMAYKIRSKKTRSVQCSLQKSGAYHSNQGEVWSEIAALQSKAGSLSPTSAMSDAFKARENDLRKCDDVFQLLPGQVGLIAFTNGTPVGMDLLSLSAAYARLHPKLIRSYALDGLLERQPESPVANGFSEKATAFLNQIASAEECQFPSIGYGTDFRYRSAPRQSESAIWGSALVHEHEVIHAAFFRMDDGPTDDLQSSPSLALLRSRRLSRPQ